MTTSQTKTILKIKRADQNKHIIMASFKNSKGEDIKESINTFWDGNLPELLLELEKQLLKLGDGYDLFEEGRWKVLSKIGGRALGGRCKNYWNDIVKGARNNGASNSNAQQKKFKKLIQ